MELTKTKYKKTEFGMIPKDWDLYTVGELIENNFIEKPLDGNHGNIHPKKSDFVNVGIPFIMANNVTSGKVDISNCNFISFKQAEKLMKGFSITGDVLLTHKGTVGNVAIVGAINTPYLMLTPQVTYYRVRDKSKLDNEYLKSYFEYEKFQRILRNLSGGGTRAYIGIVKQQELPIIIPSTLEEQKSIASALTDVDDLINKLEKLIVKKKAIKQGVMQQLLTLKDNWTTKTTHELCEKLWIGLVTTMTSNYVKQGVPLIRNSDIKVNRFKTDLINLEKNFAYTHKSRAFQEEDVATVHTGDVGTSAVVPKWLDGAHGFATINSRLKRNIISPWYYSYYLNSPLLKNQLKEVITGDGRSNLNLYDFVNLKVSFPSLVEQNIIVEILSDVDEEIERLENKKAKYQSIKQGMMQELLTGKTRLI